MQHVCSPQAPSLHSTLALTLTPAPCHCARAMAPGAAFAQQMAKLYNNLGLKMMERRKHEEALGLVRGRGAVAVDTGGRLRWWR